MRWLEVDYGNKVKHVRCGMKKGRGGSDLSGQNWRGQTDGSSMWVLKSVRQETLHRKASHHS